MLPCLESLTTYDGQRWTLEWARGGRDLERKEDTDFEKDRVVLLAVCSNKMNSF